MTFDTFLLFSPLVLLVPFFTNLVVMRLMKKSNISKAQTILLVVASSGALITLAVIDFMDWGTLSRMVHGDASAEMIFYELMLMLVPLMVVALSPVLNLGALRATNVGNLKRARAYLLWNNWLVAPLFIGIPFGILYIVGLAKAFQH